MLNSLIFFSGAENMLDIIAPNKEYRKASNPQLIDLNSLEARTQERLSHNFGCNAKPQTVSGRTSSAHQNMRQPCYRVMREAIESPGRSFIMRTPCVCRP